MEFLKETDIKASPERVFGFHELPDALERLIPPWDDVEILQRADISKIGSQAILVSTVFGLIKQKIVAEHTRYEPPHLFEDTLISSPFKKWVHQHIVLPHDGGAILRDEIEFDPGYSFVGEFGAKLIILPMMKKMFDYRHKVTKDWCEAEQEKGKTDT